MNVNLELNGQRLSFDRPVTLLNLLHEQRQSLHYPKGVEELAWINNARCPLVRLVEVDGQVVPLATWADRRLRDGMKIHTRSEQLDTVLQDRLTHLRDHQQCRFIAQLQEFAAADAESNGRVDLEKRAKRRTMPYPAIDYIRCDNRFDHDCQGVCQRMAFDRGRFGRISDFPR